MTDYAATPESTIKRQLALLKPGDALTVRPGIYRERIELVNIGTAWAPIRIEFRGPLLRSQ